MPNPTPTRGAAHTETPWYDDPNETIFDCRHGHHDCARFKRGPCGDEARSQAEAISAVNSHAALLERERVLREALEDVLSNLADLGWDRMPGSTCAGLTGACEAARAALAQSEARP